MNQNLVAGRLPILDNMFQIPLFSELISTTIAFNQQYKGQRNPDGRLVGLLIESKDPALYRTENGVEQGKLILDMLADWGITNMETAGVKMPVMLHSFDGPTVMLWH